MQSKQTEKLFALSVPNGGCPPREPPFTVKLVRSFSRRGGAVAIGGLALLFGQPAIAHQGPGSGLRVEVTAREPLGRGRLIVFVRPKPEGAVLSAVDGNAFERDTLQLAARDANFVKPRTLVLDREADAFPQDLSALPDGAIHVVVGDNDEFALDDSARRLERAIASVSGEASFQYLPGKGHFDLYVEGDERAALRRRIAWEMADRAGRTL